jgi:molecular chaperone Hsp33
VRVGDELEVVGLGADRRVIVTGTQAFHKNVEVAEAGMNVGLLLRGVGREDVERGQILAKPGSVVARVVTDEASPIEKGMFYADVVENTKPPRRSAVDFQAISVFDAVEVFYDRSEQRPVRFFRHDEEDIVMIAAQPDCDLEWLRGLTTEGIQALDQSIELSLLERRQFNFSCGCNQGRMLDFIAPVFRREADGLFGGDTSLTVTCPRCGARHILTREALEAWCAQDTNATKPDTL